MLRKFKSKHAFAVGIIVMLVFMLTNIYALVEFPLNQIGNTTEMYACQSSKQYQEWFKVRSSFVKTKSGGLQFHWFCLNTVSATL